MTAKAKPQYVCDECRYDGGIHYEVPENGGDIIASRCPNYLMAEQLEHAQKLSEEQRGQAKEATRRIIRDAAETRPVFSANDIDDELEAAQVPGSSVGNAFDWAQGQGLIRKTGRMVPSKKKNTHGHRIFEWESLVYRRAAS